MRRVVILIGASDFADKDFFPPLPGAEPDCVAMQALFVEMGFEALPFYARTWPGPTSLKRSIQQTVKSLNPGDLLVIYAATHGYRVGSSDDMLVCPESRITDLEVGETSEAVVVPWLVQRTTQPGVSRALIFDTCRCPLGGTRAGVERLHANARDLLGRKPKSVEGLSSVFDVDNPDESPLTVVHSCSRDNPRALEISALGRGLFSLAWEQAVRARLSQGKRVQFGEALDIEVTRIMGRLAREYEISGNQKPERTVVGVSPVLCDGILDTNESEAETDLDSLIRKSRERIEKATMGRRRFDELRQIYLRAAEDPGITQEELGEVWKVLCRDFGIQRPTLYPHDLAWEESGPRIILRMGHPGKGVVYENSLGMRFVPVPTTRDGSPRILASVWLTRWQDYEAYAREKPSVDRTWRGMDSGGSGMIPPYSASPVICVSWDDAVAFASWLTSKDKLEGMLPPDASYRLPSDAELSVMMGLGREDVCAGGGLNDDEKAKSTNARSKPFGGLTSAESSSTQGAGGIITKLCTTFFAIRGALRDAKSAVGEKADYSSVFRPADSGANALGIHGLGGYICEWTQDFCEEASRFRIQRGGGLFTFALPADQVMTMRHSAAPESRKNDVGFRLVLESAASK